MSLGPNLPDERRPPLCRVAARILSALLLAYDAGLLGWLAINVTAGERAPLVLLGKYLVPAGLYLPLLAIPVLVAGRDRRGIYLLLLPAALFAWRYGGFFLPRPTAAAPALPLTVVTFNMGLARADARAVSALLAATGADVIALQEVTSSTAAVLDDRLADRWPYHAYYPSAGLSLYSRYPMAAPQPIGRRPVRALMAEIRVGPARLSLVNAHLAQLGILPYLHTLNGAVLVERARIRDGQVRQILSAVEASGLPAVLACDCNATDSTITYAELASRLVDSQRERGLGLGNTLLMPRALEVPAPVNLPLVRIDYLFHSPEIAAAAVRVFGDETGSDHRPLLTVFDLGALVRAPG